MLLSQQLMVSHKSHAEDDYEEHFHDHMLTGNASGDLYGQFPQEVSSVKPPERSLKKNRLTLTSPCSYDRGVERLMNTSLHLSRV